MNLSQLRFADAVAKTASFTAAAQHCCVTQPTLSNGIAQLEAELGERLFARTTRRVTPTAFGTHLLPYIAEALRAQASVVQQARVFLNPAKQLIRIGSSPLLNQHRLALLIEPFRTRHPDVDIVLREMNMADLQRLLAQGLLDIAFGVEGTDKSTLSRAPLYREDLLFIPRHGASAGAHAASVRLKDVAGETFVMVPDACGLARATRALFRRERRKLLEYSGEAMGYQALEAWAALGIGAAILPRSRVGAGSASALSLLDKAGRPATIGFEASWSGAASRSAALREFTAYVREVIPGIVAGLHGR